MTTEADTVDPRLHRLHRLRLELYTAMQTLQGADLEEFRQLIDEIRGVLEVQGGRLPA